MAAYAALISLMNIVEQIQNHPRPPISLDVKQIESLGKKVSFFAEFIENNSHIGGCIQLEALERQIASAAHAVEDVIEFHIVDRIQPGSDILNQIQAGSRRRKYKIKIQRGKIKARSVPLIDLQKVIDDMDFVKENVIFFEGVKEPVLMMLQVERGIKDMRLTFSTPTSSPTHLNSGKSRMVGCEEELIQLMDVLTGQQSSRQIIPIVGTGGIGKTTLARNAYDNILIVQHFDIRIWVTVSQEYNLGEILLKLLPPKTKSTSGLDQGPDVLGEKLYKYLFGRRYLIILDDLWSTEAWDKIKFFMPDNNNGIRIVATTRQSNLAIHFGSTCLLKKFLDDDASWSLFCEKAFAGDGCPPELEEIGKKIARRCKGLPLSILVIGGLLGKSTRTQEHWENILKDIKSILDSGDEEQYFEILSLSYRHLPARLKPCFLYMRIFPEDHEIRISELIKLWVAEGFLKSNKTQSMEEVAEDHFKDLVDRNLILVHSLSSAQNIKTCSIHDLLRDVCLRVAEKEKFFRIMRHRDTPQGIDMERRIMVENSDGSHLTAPLVRSLICNKHHPNWSKTRLLRVLVMFYHAGYLEDQFQQVNLRYLSCIDSRYLSTDAAHLSPISLLWNVQTLLDRNASLNFPCEFWEMSQLRHLKSRYISLPRPPKSDQQDANVLQYLQTLKTVRNLSLGEEVCKRIPNLKKLNIEYDIDWRSLFGSSFSGCGLCSLCCLRKLESLSISFMSSPKEGDFLANVSFPTSLKKLSLRFCNLRWEELTMIGSLPCLEVLKLKYQAVTGEVWNPIEGEFLRLKYLHISSCDDLEYWNANSSHFPILENLVLHSLSELDEIPLDIGEIPTLRVIHLFLCSESAMVSALRILNEQESLGNDDLQVQIKFSTWDEEEFKEEFERFRETAEQEYPETLKNKNLRLIYS